MLSILHALTHLILITMMEIDCIDDPYQWISCILSLCNITFTPHNRLSLFHNKLSLFAHHLNLMGFFDQNNVVEVMC